MAGLNHEGHEIREDHEPAKAWNSCPSRSSCTSWVMRVIAGRSKGRRLKSPDWSGLRPTSDKLRETLFNVLAPRIDSARVVDGYAGTGAIGIEALSRGAAHVTFIDKNRRAVALIEENLS